MEIFKDGHLTQAAQKLDEIMAAESQYWEARETEYGHQDQDIPGRTLVVHYLPPGMVMLETCSGKTTQSPYLKNLEVA